MKPEPLKGKETFKQKVSSKSEKKYMDSPKNSSISHKSPLKNKGLAGCNILFMDKDIKSAVEGFVEEAEKNKTKGNTNTEKGFDRGLDFCIKLAKKWFEDVSEKKITKENRHELNEQES